MIDLDGYLLLNIWSDADLLKLSTYPVVTTGNDICVRPNIVFIGDSFSGQIRYTLQQATAYFRMVFSNYFSTREIDDKGSNEDSMEKVEIGESDIREKLMADIVNSDIVILEMVDYNVSRWGYGFADYFMDMHKLLDNRWKIQIACVTGAYDRETDGKNWWHWVEQKMSFRIQPRSIPKEVTKTRVRFDYVTRGNQKLTLNITTNDGAVHEIFIQGKSGELELFDKILDMPPSEIAEFALETDGIASPLGENDPRIAAWIIRNISVSPVLN